MTNFILDWINRTYHTQKGAAQTMHWGLPPDYQILFHPAHS